MEISLFHGSKETEERLYLSRVSTILIVPENKPRRTFNYRKDESEH